MKGQHSKQQIIYINWKVSHFWTRQELTLKMNREKENVQSERHSAMMGEDVERTYQDQGNETMSDRVVYITRGLVKNNIVRSPLYLMLLTLEYLCMVYYILRVVDNKTLNDAFSGIENFMDVGNYKGMPYSYIQQQSLANNATTIAISGGVGESFGTMLTNMQNKATTHVIINAIFCGLYTLFVLMFFTRTCKIKNFDSVLDQSYTLKTMSAFMVLTQTILQIPVLASIFIAIKALTLGLVSSSVLFISLICVTLLIVEFSFVAIFALKFFNLEVPNEDVAWSYNQTGGVYFKLLLKLTLCSQELYRYSLTNEDISVQIICIAFILVFETIIIVYRMNSPNIFNTLLHDFTTILESFLISFSLIGLIALVTQRDILSTLAYLCIFIPIIVKIFSTIDASRKHFILFKLKGEENLSNNEYLIAITHLLKMIKAQTDEDIAQLLSFTYNHKLYCYDQDCVCQFFTQYCQDPIKFKDKKRRAYRGYQDDGLKLLHKNGHQIYDGDNSGNDATEEQSVHANINNQQSLGMNNQQSLGMMRRNQEDNAIKFDISTIDGPNNSSNLGGGLFQTNATGLDYESQFDLNVAIDVSQIDINGNFVSGMNAQRPDAVELHDENATTIVGQGFQEYKEKGINAMYVKGDILKGSAFNGFDSNTDFKTKGEFKSPSSFKNHEDSRTYFFTRLLETMFKQLESRTNKNVSFTLISIYFHFAYQHNIYLAALSLVKMAKSLKNSIISKLTFSVTEYYLLELIVNNFKQHTKDEIDYTKFIEQNQMQSKLDWLFEDASQDIIQFWRLFKEEQANVMRAYHLGMTISNNIALIRDYTAQLEQKSLIKDFNKYYYYAMFYQNLLNDRVSYNMMINNLRNMLMIRNMQKKNSRFGGSQQDVSDIGFAIFTLEETGVSEKNVGKFIYCNKSACMILKTTEEDVIGKSAIQIMPELIRANHDQFIKRFLSDGLNRMVGKVRNVYIRDFNGFIKPVQFFINFYYNSKFSYSFLMHLDPVSSFTYFGTNTEISIKYTIILLCSQENTIQNMSESTRKLLGLTQKRMREEEEILGRSLTMQDIVQNFVRIENAIHQNKVMFLPNFQVRVRDFRYSLMSNDEAAYIPCLLTYEETTYLKGFHGQFTERVYIIIPKNKVPESEQSNLVQISGNHAQSLTQNVNSGVQYNSKENQQQNNSFMSAISNSSSAQQDAGMSASVSSMGSSASASTASGSTGAKTLLFQQKSPKILNIYLSIVFSVLASFMIITSINFVIYLERKNNITLQIQFNQIITQRNIYLMNTILDIKEVQLTTQPTTISAFNNTGNYSGVFQPPYSMDRNGYYSNQMLSDANIMLTNHQQYMQMSQRYNNLGQNDGDPQFQGITYYVQSLYGQVYPDTNTLKYGLDMLISNIEMVNPSDLNSPVLPMDLSKYNISQTSNGTATQIFENLFYIYTNGMAKINHLIQVVNDFVVNSAVSTSQSSNVLINLISFISIGLISFIGIFTFPMLGKIEDRKISVLKFFNLLSVEQIQVIILRGEDYREQLYQMQRGGAIDRNAQINHEETEEEDERPTDFNASRKEDYPNSKVVKISSRKNQKGDNNDDDAGYKNMVQKMKVQKQNNVKKVGKGKGTELGLKSAFKNSKIEEEYKEDGKYRSGRHSSQNSVCSKNNKKDKRKLDQKLAIAEKDEVIEEEEDEDDDEDSVEEDEEEVEGEDGKKIAKAKKKHDAKKHKRREQAHSATVSANMLNEQNRTDHINDQLERVAFREKIKLAFFVFIVLVFLNSCLIACFAIGQKTFQQTQTAINGLTTFYHRENCLGNLLLYSIEQFVKNETIIIDDTVPDAVQYYLDYCQLIELQYNQLRQTIPTFLLGSQNDIESLESSNLCTTVYSQTQNQQYCETVYNSIMQQGLTQTLYTIFTYMQQQYVSFNNQQNRSLDFLNHFLSQDMKFRNMTDISRSYIQDTFQYIQSSVTSTTISYFDQLASYYMIIFGVYMGISVLLVFVFGLFVFKKLRMQIITSANILAIMPMEDLELRDRQKIEAFLNS